MWLPRPLGRRRLCIAVAALAVLALAGCGFQPLYGTRGKVPAALAKVRIAQIADRAGQQLRNHLLLRISPDGPPRRPDYVLKVGLSESKRKLSVQQDDVATRVNLKIDADYRLERASDGTKVFTGTVSTTNSYNILESEFGTLKAETTARARGVRELSDSLTARLAVHLGGRR
jgi:LPS-assembly lipoprotein